MFSFGQELEYKQIASASSANLFKRKKFFDVVV